MAPDPVTNAENYLPLSLVSVGAKDQVQNLKVGTRQWDFQKKKKGHKCSRRMNPIEL